MSTTDSRTDHRGSGLPGGGNGHKSLLGYNFPILEVFTGYRAVIITDSLLRSSIITINITRFINNYHSISVCVFGLYVYACMCVCTCVFGLC